MTDLSPFFAMVSKQTDKPRFVVAELSFRNGNHLLKTWAEFEKVSSSDQKLHYYAIEKNPLSATDIRAQIGSEYQDYLNKLLSLYPMRVEGWHTLYLSAQVTLTLILGDAARELPQLNTPIDCWILDEAAPSEFLSENIKRLSRSDTYVCSKLTNDIGTIQNGAAPQLIRKFIPQKIAIIGGGIAGATLTYRLSARGCDVTLFEKNGLASGGSGNDRGLCNPRISASKGPEADFYSPAFNLAHRVFADLSINDDIGFQACGSIHMISDENKDKRYHGFKDKWGWHDDHAQIISAADASDAAGIQILHPSLYFEGAGMVSPKKATQKLAASAKLNLQEITQLEEDGSHWRINGEHFDAVILAGSFDVLQFSYTRTLPIEKVRGQVTKIKASPLYNQLKANLCYGGYASVAEQGEAIIGSTFQTWISDPALRDEDDIDNISKLQQVVPHLAEGLTVVGGRASFRSAAKDRSPIVGQIHGVENLYISTAHGSHGILSSIMGAEYLTAKMMGDAQILPKSVEQFLDPSRFKKI